MQKEINDFLNFADSFLKRQRVATGIFLVCWTTVVLFFLLPNRGMSPVWSVPYFSGAANLEPGSGWYFLPGEVDSLQQKKGWDYYTYQFKKGGSKELQSYSHNVAGYLYWVYAAHKLIPVFNEVFSIVFLQVLLHVMICIFTLKLLVRTISRFAFLFLYAVNPLIIYLVTFPFYYFLQSIASLIIILFYFHKRRTFIWSLSLIIILIMVFMTRKTVLPLGIMLTGVLVLQKRYLLSLLNLAGLILIPFFLENTRLNPSKTSGPWHPAFIGIGAYPNPYRELNELSDNCGVFLYRKEVDSSFNWEISGKYMKDQTVMSSYQIFIKNRYLGILKDNPFLLVRNAAINFFQGYSVGHLSNKAFILNLMIAVSGLIFFLLLVRKKEWFFLIAIGLSHLAFSPYYPPIPAYFFGSYILIVFCLCKVFLDSEPKATLTGTPQNYG